jgi:hypothetical protein
MIEAEEPGADFSHDGGEAHPMRVMRLTLLEFEILTELGVEPMRVDHVPVTVVEAIARLLLKELVSQEEQRITITERGRRLLGVPPLSQTSYTVAFDFRALRW